MVLNPSSVWFTPLGVTSRKKSSSRNLPTLNASVSVPGLFRDLFSVFDGTTAGSSSVTSNPPYSSSSELSDKLSSESSPSSETSSTLAFVGLLLLRATIPCPVSFALSMCLSCAFRFACIADDFLAAAASSPWPFAACAISASNTVAAGRYARICRAMSANPTASICDSSRKLAHSVGDGPISATISAPRATLSFPALPRVL